MDLEELGLPAVDMVNDSKEGAAWSACDKIKQPMRDLNAGIKEDIRSVIFM